jgi:hypothetical protein
LNHLLLGAADKTDRLLEITKPRFLLIDDGPIADAFLERFPKARLFDPAVHSFNPLAGMDYRRARDFADILYASSPGGKDTLTVRNGRRALVRMLLAKPSRLSDMPEPSAVKDDAEKEALGMIEELLMSPVLSRVLCGRGTPFRFGEGTTVAKLDRAELGDFDAFIIGALLIGHHKGEVVLSDGGFYARDLHMSLIRQNRLTIGCNLLSELPQKIRQASLLFEDKTARLASYEDAKLLAQYACLIEGTNAFGEFVRQAVVVKFPCHSRQARQVARVLIRPDAK